MKVWFMSLVMVMCATGVVLAEDYSVSVTRKGKNLYKVDGKDIYIYAKYCHEYAYSAKAFLSMSGYQGRVTFSNSGNKCDVKGVYGTAEQSAGDYNVRVNQESDDWYEISGTNMFVRTSSCMSMAMGSEAVLSINAGGYGSIFIDRTECAVEGVFGRMSL